MDALAEEGALLLSLVWRRKLKPKAKLESSLSYFSYKRLDPGGFNLGLIGSTCTALPWAPSPPSSAPWRAGHRPRCSGAS